MKYRIIGNTMPAVEVEFDFAGESIYTQCLMESTCPQTPAAAS